MKPLNPVTPGLTRGPAVFPALEEEAGPRLKAGVTEEVCPLAGKRRA
jgi:hypothetical protein